MRRTLTAMAAVLVLGVVAVAVAVAQMTDPGGGPATQEQIAAADSPNVKEGKKLEKLEGKLGRDKVEKTLEKHGLTKQTYRLPNGELALEPNGETATCVKIKPDYYRVTFADDCKPGIGNAVRELEAMP
jgi:hypothetical protein